MSIQEFRSKFRFQKHLAGYFGVERECFIANQAGIIVPAAYEILSSLTNRQDFGYELSACQIESRVGPCALDDLSARLATRDREQEAAFKRFGYRPLHAEVGPAYMPVDVYPDPTGRYARIAARMPRERLQAACRVIGTHIHIGMPDHESALRVYNAVVPQCQILCAAGDGSSGERLALYKQVAPQADPPSYPSWEELYLAAVECGFAEDPRQCWTLIRLSVHGTIEFRMFGATASLGRIFAWAQSCHRLCMEALG